MLLGSWAKITYKSKGKTKEGYAKMENLLKIRRDSFANTAIDCHKYIRTNGYTYNADSNQKRIQLNVTRTSDKHYIDCSQYVTVVLYEYNKDKYSYFFKKDKSGNYIQFTSTDFKKIGSDLKNIKKKEKEDKKLSKYETKLKNAFKLVNYKDAQRGDILVYNGHVEILAYPKNDYVYNCGSKNAIKAAESSKSSKLSNDIVPLYILRVK